MKPFHILLAIWITLGIQHIPPVLAQEEEKEPFYFLALGDSYTIGTGVEEWESWPVALRKLLKNPGGYDARYPDIVARNGWTTKNLLAAMRRFKFREEYNLVLILIGANDQFRGSNPESYRKDFEQVVQRAIKLAGGDDRRVVVLSIPDWGYSPYGRRKNRKRISRAIDRFNEINEEISSDKRETLYVDLTSISRKYPYPIMFARDGLHPSAYMHNIWAKIIYSQINHTLREAEEETVFDEYTVEGTFLSAEAE